MLAQEIRLGWFTGRFFFIGGWGLGTRLPLEYLDCQDRNDAGISNWLLIHKTGLTGLTSCLAPLSVVEIHDLAFVWGHWYIWTHILWWAIIAFS